MSNTVLFLFHNTLTREHLEMSLSSLLDRQTVRLQQWDRLIVHNTHSTITNDDIRSILSRHPDRFGSVVFLQPMGQAGSLHQDLRTCFSYIKDNIKDGHILVLKGDYSLSSNFMDVYLQARAEMGENSQWSLPIYNAKEFVDDWDILSKLDQPYFELTNNDTYYRCGTNIQHTPHDEVLSRLGKRDDDPSVKFVAHNVLPDYNLHVFGWKAAHMVTECFDAMPVFAGWNCVGDMFKMLMTKGVKYYNATRAFGVHKFHATDRGDPRKMIPGQRY